MTHYHLYIECGDTLDETTRIYKVGIGTGKQADRDYLFILAHSVDHNHFFHLIDDPTWEFYRHIRDTAENFDPTVTVIRARQFVKHLKANTRPSHDIEAMYQRHRMNHALNIAYRISDNLNVLRSGGKVSDLRDT